MSLTDPSMGAASMGLGTETDPGQPPSGAPGGNGALGLFAFAAPFFQFGLSLLESGEVFVENYAENRPVRGQAPIATAWPGYRVVANVQGPERRESADGLSFNEMICVFIKGGDVRQPILPDDQIRFDNRAYTVTVAERLPKRGPVSVWRVEAERGV